MASYVNIDGEWVCTSVVEFLGIEEGMFGEDIIEFEYKGKRYKRTVHKR